MSKIFRSSVLAFFLLASAGAIYAQDGKAFVKDAEKMRTAGQLDNALEQYGFAIRVDSNYVKALLGRASLYLDMGRMADAFAKSNLFGVKTKDAALSLLMIAQAEGIHPALAVMEYDIIEGKPARKAERLLARFQMSGSKVEWIKYKDTIVVGKFSHG